ncbi:hypothetical protein GS597_18255 [Synechococcales cyanobacterium C]|uniref:Uncharacterized protein n=1 Tax=Petrachloros mirabilis ULC683 TaxID=2781853 RepID=A0A8K1ZZY1_9CYAN|nr:hypothetical protein [Petrachloros mirabilis]NCJ08415.1 hypothetical protein [Petrachloros mirabilis ULC683]
MLLSGRYEIRGTLFGSGIFSEYLCVDTLDSAAPQVVVQCVNLEPLDSETQGVYQQHFNESGRRIKFLSTDKPGVTKIRAYFFEDCKFYVVSQRVSAQTLDSLEGEPFFLLQVWLQAALVMQELDQFQVAGILVSDCDVVIRSDEVWIRPYLHPKYAEYSSLLAFNLYSLAKFVQKALVPALEKYQGISEGHSLISEFQKLLDDLLANQGHIDRGVLDEQMQKLSEQLSELSEAAAEVPDSKPSSLAQEVFAPEPSPSPQRRDQQRLKAMVIALGCVSGAIHGAFIGGIFSLLDETFYQQAVWVWLQDFWQQINGVAWSSELSLFLGLMVGLFCGFALTLKLEVPVATDALRSVSPPYLKRRFWQGIKYANVFGLFDMVLLAALLAIAPLFSVFLLNRMLNNQAILLPWAGWLNVGLLTLVWMSWVGLTAGVSVAVPEVRLPNQFHVRAISAGVGAACAVLAIAFMSPMAVSVLLQIGMPLEEENWSAVLAAALVTGSVSAVVCAWIPKLPPSLPHPRPFWTGCFLPSLLYTWGMTLAGGLLLGAGAAILGALAGFDLASLFRPNELTQVFASWLLDLLLAVMTGVIPAIMGGVAANRALPRMMPPPVQPIP